MRGLGDMLERVIAWLVPRVADAPRKSCGGCAKRRDALNRAVPFVEKSSK